MSDAVQEQSVTIAKLLLPVRKILDEYLTLMFGPTDLSRCNVAKISAQPSEILVRWRDIGMVHTGSVKTLLTTLPLVCLGHERDIVIHAVYVFWNKYLTEMLLHLTVAVHAINYRLSARNLRLSGPLRRKDDQ